MALNFEIKKETLPDGRVLWNGKTYSQILEFGLQCKVPETFVKYFLDNYKVKADIEAIVSFAKENEITVFRLTVFMQLILNISSPHALKFTQINY